jgi:hypothetical protein
MSITGISSSNFQNNINEIQQEFQQLGRIYSRGICRPLRLILQPCNRKARRVALPRTTTQSPKNSRSWRKISNLETFQPPSRTTRRFSKPFRIEQSILARKTGRAEPAARFRVSFRSLAHS